MKTIFYRDVHIIGKYFCLKKPFEIKFDTESLITLAKTEIIYPKNVRAKVAMDFT